MYRNMRRFFEGGYFNKETITLNLINKSSTDKSTIRLFPYPDENSVGTPIYEGVLSMNDFWFNQNGVTWWLVMLNGATIKILDNVFFSNAAMVHQACIDNTDADWTLSGAAVKTLSYSNSSLNIDKLINDATPLQGKFNNVQSGISGSDVAISEQSQLENYIANCNELNNGYYKLDNVDVFADNIEQANIPFTVNKRVVSGRENKSLTTPSISPIQPQFVNLDVPLNYSPSPTGILDYALNPSQSVKLIFKYSKSKAYQEAIPSAIVLDKEIGVVNDSENEKSTEAQGEEPPLIEAVKNKIILPRKSKLEITKKELLNYEIDEALVKVDLPHEREVSIIKEEVPILSLLDSNNNESSDRTKSLVRETIERGRLSKLNLGDLSDDNIKRKVANHIVNNIGGSTTYDPYLYMTQ